MGPASSGNGVRARLISVQGWVGVGEGRVVGVVVGCCAAVAVWVGTRVAVRVGVISSPVVIGVRLAAGDETISGRQAVSGMDKRKTERSKIRDKRLHIVTFLT